LKTKGLDMKADKAIRFKTVENVWSVFLVSSIKCSSVIGSVNCFTILFELHPRCWLDEFCPEVYDDKPRLNCITLNNQRVKLKLSLSRRCTILP
jgi:hypothetical protein